MVGAPHVQLLGEAVLRSRRMAAGLVADTVPSETSGSYSGLFIETRNRIRGIAFASAEAGDRTHPALFLFFRAMNMQAKRIEGTRAEPESVS